jgi:tRNA dimethylallyltransferase
MKKVLVICGPTATGKTDLGLFLAKKFNGELIAADSRQVYTGLDIGTGKMPGKESGKDLEVIKGSKNWDIDGVKIWMYDVCNPMFRYSVSEFIKDAGIVLDDIEKRGKLPIIVGGTGLYIKALVEGLSNLIVPVDQKLREELESLTLKQLQEKLAALSPTRFENLNNSDRQNPRRLVRSIELIVMNPYVDKSLTANISYKDLDILKIGLTAPRQVLYEKVDLRVLSWIDQGMIEEVVKLRGEGLTLERMRILGLEYGVLADFLEDKITKEQLITSMQFRTHDYVRRQLTWFKKVNDINWFDTSKKDFTLEVEKMVGTWYYGRHDKKN